MNTIWLVMIAIGILTFATRLSFIVLFEKWKPPRLVQRALRYVPAAVLSAIILPEIVLRDGVMDLSMANPRLLAGVVAVLVAWKTKSVVWTIVAGMAVLWALLLLAG